MPRVYILTGTTSFADPGNWNDSNNKVECIGGGGNGGITSQAGIGCAGGAGGNYASATVVMGTSGLAFPVPVVVSPGGSGLTYFFQSAQIPGAVLAGVGANASLNGPGIAGGVTYPSGFTGGSGAPGLATLVGGGGGGAAGPLGAGGAAGTGAIGGAGGSVGGGSGQGFGGQAGNPGYTWDATHGPGGGGGGGVNTTTKNGGAGANYGGGGAGAYKTSGLTVAPGAPGLIVISWIPPAPSLPAGVSQVFLLNGATSFADPGTWDAAHNKVECIGSGMKGNFAYTGPELRDDDINPLVSGNLAGGAGGGGGYGYANNLNPTFPVTVNVAAKNQTGVNNSPSTANTYWNTSSLTAGSVQGYCGSSAGQNVGGPGGNFYPNGFIGGSGGSGGGSGSGGGGGGGAGGPNGAGGNGNTPPNGLYGGAGGAANGGLVPGGVSGANGSSGFEWDSTHGCGSGGGGSNSGTAVTINGGAGGAFGGGGGGQGAGTNSTAGDGVNGLLIITWTRKTPPGVGATAGTGTATATSRLVFRRDGSAAGTGIATATGMSVSVQEQVIVMIVA